MILFHWVVRRARWLARIPGMTRLFDALLLAWSCIFRKERVAAMEAIEAEAEKVMGLRLGVHHFGGTAFLLADREIGHVHGNGLLDVRFSVARARELIAAGQAGPHHVFPRSGWVSFQIESPCDTSHALGLLRDALCVMAKSAVPDASKGGRAVTDGDGRLSGNAR